MSQNYLEPVKQRVSDMETVDSNLELHGFAEASETALCSLRSVLQHMNTTFVTYIETLQMIVFWFSDAT
jgi:hypothetical protein